MLRKDIAFVVKNSHIESQIKFPNAHMKFLKWHEQGKILKDRFFVRRREIFSA